MTDSNATFIKNITIDLPDHALGTVVFQLTTLVSISSVGEIFMANDSFYTVTLSASGQGDIDLPTPDGDGTAAWEWRVKLPDTKATYFTLQWSAGSVSLAILIAAAITTVTPSDIIALLAAYVEKGGDTMTGLLILSGNAVASLGAVTLQQMQSADIPEPTDDNLIYGRSTDSSVSTWERAVAVTGDEWLGDMTPKSDTAINVVYKLLTGGATVGNVGMTVSSKILSIGTAGTESGWTTAVLANTPLGEVTIDATVQVEVKKLLDTALVAAVTISGSTYTLEPTARKWNITLQSNVTITLGDGNEGDSFVAVLIQDVTGSRVPTFVKAEWGDAGAPTFTTTPATGDIVTFMWHTDVWLATAGLGFTL